VTRTVSANQLAFLPVAVLLAGAVLQVLLARVLSGAGKGWLALVAGVASFAAVAGLWPTTVAGGSVDAVLGAWDGPIALAYHVDGLGLLFALMGTGIGSAVLLFSIGYMARDESSTRFYVLMQLFIAGLVNLVYSANLLLLYASWELVGVCSFLLVGFWYRQPEAAAGARKVFVITHTAGYALLAAILILWARTGSLTWTDPSMRAAFTTGVFALMFIAAMAKSVQFPLHTWIPSAMAAPTPVSSLLHSACYVTAGVYLVARMHSFAPWPVEWQTTVVWVGTVTMVVGILFAMVQDDAKKMLAFSTVSQIGYMMLGLGLSTAMGIVAGLLHCLNHGLFKGGLFLGAGSVQHATGTRNMNELGGLSRVMPKTTTLWLVSAASIAGVPLFNGFVSKWLIYVAALSAGYVLPALVAWIVSILTMFTLLKATSSMFFGEETPASAGAHEATPSMLSGFAILAIGCVVFGIAPQLAVNYAVAPSLASMGLTSDISASWLGISAAGSSFYTLAGLALAILSLLAGGAIYLFATTRHGARSTTPSGSPSPGGPAAVGRTTGGAADPAPIPAFAPRPAAVLASTGPAGFALPALGLAADDRPPVFTGGEALSARGRMRSSDFSALALSGLGQFYRWADPDRYLLAIWHGTLGACEAAGQLGKWLELRAVLAVVAIATTVGVIAAGTSGVARTAEAASHTAPTEWPFVVAIAIALVALVLAQLGEGLTRLAWLALAGVLALAGLAFAEGLVRLALLEASAFAAVGLLVVSRVDRSAWLAYLGAAVFSAVALVLGAALTPSGPPAVVLGLLIAGFAVKFALVPAYLWLPAVADRAPSALVGAIVAVVDAAAFAELIALRGESPWLFEPVWPWVALALLSAVGAAGLMLAEKSLRRMLALSATVGAGFIVLATAVGGMPRLVGPNAAAAAEVLAMALLFVTVSAAEKTGDVRLGIPGLARAHPLAAAGFVLGTFAALGLPFTAGWAGHWRAYASALELGGLPLAALILATILSVLAYSRVIALVWWGTSDAAVETPARLGDNLAEAPTPPTHPLASENAALVFAILLLMLAVVATGLAPELFGRRVL
jgi:multicomponent Na+:H+ antiporter subunit A